MKTLSLRVDVDTLEGSLKGIEILLDQDLGLYETVFPAAGNDATGVRTTLAQLAQVTGGRIVAFKD